MAIADIVKNVKRKLGLSNSSAQGSFPHIFRLPTEILGTIFIHCACDHQSKLEARCFPPHGVPSWVNVSYVCHHWRSVALDCPTLWTYLFVTSPRWTEVFLARSKSTPVKVYMIMRELDGLSAALRFVEQVMDHVERIQELHLYVPDFQNVSGILHKLSSHGAPQLQVLTISDVNRITMPFGGDTPTLRTLKLSYCPVPWYLFKLNSLTTLSLECVPVQYQQGTEEFLATLSRLQNLKHLYLHDALASAASFPSSAASLNSQKIHLPHLFDFLIVAPLSTVIALLSCIDISLKTRVRLQWHFERDAPPDHFALVCSLLAQRITMLENHQSRLSSPTVLSLVIEFHPALLQAMLTFSASQHNYDPFMPSWDWDYTTPLQIIVSPPQWQSTRVDRDRVISDLCRSIPLRNVQSVRVINPPSGSSALWDRILEQLPDIRRLKLSEGYMHLPDLTSILSLSPRNDAENRGEHPVQGADQVLPALTALQLYRIGFISPLERRTTAPSNADPNADIQSFYDALSTRRMSQGQLTMTQCGFLYGNHPGFKNMVGRWEKGRFRVVKLVRPLEGWFYTR